MKKNKYISILLIIFCLCSSIFTFCEPRRASANPAVLTLTGEQVAVLAGALYAYGVQIKENPEAVAQYVYDNLSSVSWIDDAITYAQGGTASIRVTAEMLDSLDEAGNLALEACDIGWEYVTEGASGGTTTVNPNGYNWVSSALPHTEGTVSGTIAFDPNSGEVLIRQSDINGNWNFAGCHYLSLSYDKAWVGGTFGHYEYQLHWKILNNTSLVSEGTMGNFFEWAGQNVTFSMSIAENEAVFDVNGTIVGSVSIASGVVMGAVQLLSVNNSTSLAYSTSATVTGTLEPGMVEDTDPKRVAVPPLGSDITIPLNDPYNPTNTVNPPGTLVNGAETFLEQVMGRIEALLGTGLNAIRGILSNIYALLQTIAGYLANPAPDFFNQYRDLWIGYWDSHKPTIPNLDTTQFVEPEFNWTITIPYPFSVTFEVMNSDFVEEWRPTVKAWFGGVMIFATVIWVIKRTPEVIKV